MKRIFSKSLGFAKQHPYTSLAASMGLLATTAYGLYTLQDKTVEIGAGSLKTQSAHSAHIEVGNVTSVKGSSHLLAQGENAKLQAGNIVSGQDTEVSATNTAVRSVKW